MKFSHLFFIIVCAICFSCRFFPNNRESILFIGDSLISLWDVQSKFPDCAISNEGLAGDAIGNMTKRIKQTCESMTYDKIFILIGTNDTRYCLWAKMSDSDAISHIIINFDHLIDLLNTIKSRYYLISVLPVSHEFIEFPWNRMNKINDAVNKHLREVLTKSNNGTFIDGASMICDYDKSLIPYFSTDGLHLNYLGYQRLQIGISYYVFQ
jgi:lysophospholipase L1-like esterase